ncbi:MAG: putative manganese-dependent inorganic diphosphatase [Verrucomicrobiae bacterium]|nr:putative manganese-dependent inorganic diphosphatase [Verrucomicrobiae bacterium]
MREVLVIGHRNPDPDAVCSAIGYAEFKRRTGLLDAVAARCGDTNERIDFILRTFGLPAPRFVADVSPRVGDVMETNVLSVSPDATVTEAMTLMDNASIRVLPILDGQRRCRALVSVFKSSKFFYPAEGRPFDSRRVMGSLRGLTRALRGRMLCAFEPDREDDLTMMIGAMSRTSFAARLDRNPPEKLLVLVGDRVDIQQLAVSARVRALVVTGGLAVTDEIVEEARRNEVSLIVSPVDTATTAMLCRAAIPVRHLQDEHFLSFHRDEPLRRVREMATSSGFPAFPVVDDDRRVVGMLTKSDFLKPVERQLILVDHNELSQAVAGADEVEIIEIIDHHRIGALRTRQPILFRNEPVGSTSTIVADCFFRYGVELPAAIAGVLLSGLVADTLNLTSPTTTARDAEILARLEERSGVRAREFTERLFESGSILVSHPPETAIVSDCKEYAEGELKYSVAQIEEIGFDNFRRRQDAVRAAVGHYRRSHGYFFSALLVTDVVEQTSLLVIDGDPDFLKTIDYPEVEPGLYEMAGIVSRKKQLLPYLTHQLARCPALDRGAGRGNLQ